MRSLPRVLVILVPLGILARPGVGTAADAEPGVAILDVRAQAPVTARQAEAVRASLARGLADFRVRVPEDNAAVIAAHTESEVSTAVLTEARARAREGKKLLEELDPAGAEKKLRAAADLFEKDAGALSSPSDLIGTYLLLARVFFATEREVLARDIFRRVVQLQPDLTLDRAVYPPGMISVFEDVKKSVLSSPLGSMNVASTPSPAVVFLDGRERGKTPLDLVNLVAGVHTLALRRPGYAPWVRPVDVTTFRVDHIQAELSFERHPTLELAFVDKGSEQKDSLGLTIGDWLDAVGTAANLDVEVLGRLSRSGRTYTLELRAYRPRTHEWSPVMKFPFNGRPPRHFTDPAGAVLGAAARAGWIPSIAARRNLTAGGGALDETAKFAFRASIAPEVRVGGSPRNFPDGPAAGFRVGLDYRLSPHLLLTSETGFDYVSQSRIVLVGSGGTIVADKSRNVEAVYTSIPLDGGARYYLGVGTFAPFVDAGLGLRFDQLQFRESLPFDSIKGSSGVGLDAFAGTGFDYALGLRDGLFAQARLRTGTIGVGNARVHTTATPPQPDRTLRVKPGVPLGVRIYVGYLHVF